MVMADGVPDLETERLLLRPLGLADAPEIQQKFPKPEIIRWLGAAVPWPYPADGAETFLKQVVLSATLSGTAWHWSLRRRADPATLIGVISLRNTPEDNRGFWLDTEWHGIGLMTEACDAVTDYWFRILGRTVLRVPKAVDNVASRRISQRQGMRVVRREVRQMAMGACESELWEITAAEWNAQRQ